MPRSFSALRWNWHTLFNLWGTVQVELRGSYSTQRVLELAKHERVTNWLRDTAVLVGIPLPCVLATVLIDTLPLANPSDGVKANSMSFLRVYYSFVIFGFVATHQVRTIMPRKKFNMLRGVMVSVVVAAITVGMLYLLARAIGFPLPFSIMMVSPAWVTLMSISVIAEWADKIRHSRKTQRAVINLIKLWVCDALMVFIYPTYYYVFTTLSGGGQRAFAFLLPVIKLLMRNLFAHVTAHLPDATPEFVVFHAEVFNSLFISYCLQVSPSFLTTLQMTLSDVLLLAISLYDIERARRGLRNLEHRINKDNNWGSACKIGGNLEHTTLGRASLLLEKDENRENTRVSTVQELMRIASYHEKAPTNQEKSRSERFESAARSIVVLPKKFSVPKIRSTAIHPIGPSAPREDGSREMSITLRYTCKVRRLLYIAEFLVLLNYVKISIPMIFTINMLTAYHLPNRHYYPIFNGMNRHQLLHTLQHVMFYCFLQLVSFAVLTFTLKRMLGISPTHQLVFVLKKQFHRMHSSLVFWVYYNVQASLQHSGIIRNRASNMLPPSGLIRYSVPKPPSPPSTMSYFIESLKMLKAQAHTSNIPAPLFGLIAVVCFVYHFRLGRSDQFRGRTRHLVTNIDSDADDEEDENDDDSSTSPNLVAHPTQEWNIVGEDGTQALSLVFYPEKEGVDDGQAKKIPPQKLLILVVPGNPGNPYYYLQLMQEVAKEHGRRHEICCLSHAGHVMPWKNHNRYFSLQEQLDQKTFYLKLRLREDPTLRFVVIGQSVGRYIALDIAKRFDEQVVKLVLMQPAIMYMALSQRGRQMIPLLNNYDLVVMFVEMIECVVPISLRRWTVRRAVRSKAQPVQLASLSLMNSSVIQNVLGMAASEMKYSTNLDENIVKKHENKILFVYSTVDEWVPGEFMQENQL